MQADSLSTELSGKPESPLPVSLFIVYNLILPFSTNRICVLCWIPGIVFSMLLAWNKGSLSDPASFSEVVLICRVFLFTSRKSNESLSTSCSVTPVAHPHCYGAELCFL